MVRLCPVRGLISSGGPPFDGEKTKTSPSGSNIGGSITHFKTILLMWHVVNEERGVCGNLASYCNITLIKANVVYSLINKTPHICYSPLWR